MGWRSSRCPHTSRILFSSKNRPPSHIASPQFVPTIAQFRRLFRIVPHYLTLIRLQDSLARFTAIVSNATSGCKPAVNRSIVSVTILGTTPAILNASHRAVTFCLSDVPRHRRSLLRREPTPNGDTAAPEDPHSQRTGHAGYHPCQGLDVPVEGVGEEEAPHLVSPLQAQGPRQWDALDEDEVLRDPFSAQHLPVAPGNPYNP